MGARLRRAAGVSESHRASRELAPEDRFADRYHLLERVGGGGMGDVWAALDDKQASRMALKVIALEGAQTEHELTLARFKREAELSAQLRASAFAEVYDHGVWESWAYLAMELFEGESLHERLRRVHRLTPAEALVLLKGIAEGLRLVHALQIVHRDLKPANIYYARRGASDSGVRLLREPREDVKLLDFGIAKDTWVQSRLTQPGVILGSALYMSPEQIRSGSDVDTRSDLWSLGVILFRALTGERPFPGAAADVLARIMFDEVPAPSTLHAGWAQTMDAFFAKALAKEPARRFQTIDEMVQAFEAAVEQQPAIRWSERPSSALPAQGLDSGVSELAALLAASTDGSPTAETKLDTPPPFVSPAADVRPDAADRPLVSEPRPSARPARDERGRSASIGLSVAVVLLTALLLVGAFLLYRRLS